MRKARREEAYLFKAEQGRDTSLERKGVGILPNREECSEEVANSCVLTHVYVDSCVLTHVYVDSRVLTHLYIDSCM